MCVSIFTRDIGVQAHPEPLRKQLGFSSSKAQLPDLLSVGVRYQHRVPFAVGIDSADQAGDQC